MAVFDCLVDTRPMADTVGTISQQVKETTTAVAVMQAAVIAAEKNAADDICKNVDRGFFSLIRSQMSAKLAQYYTDMTVKLMLLSEQAKMLASLQLRMESDVNRLKREYYKIFCGLDKSLENRIRQLDRSAVGLADQRENLISDRILKDASEVILTGRDSGTIEQMALMARVKNKTSSALRTIGENIQENQEYENQLSGHLQRQRMERQSQECIPVVISSEQSMVMRDASVLQCHFPEFLQNHAKDQVQSAVMQSAEYVLNRERVPEENEKIKNEFQKMLSEAGLSERVSAEMLRLFGNGGC